MGVLKTLIAHAWDLAETETKTVGFRYRGVRVIGRSLLLDAPAIRGELDKAMACLPPSQRVRATRVWIYIHSSDYLGTKPRRGRPQTMKAAWEGGFFDRGIVEVAGLDPDYAANVGAGFKALLEIQDRG